MENITKVFQVIVASLGVVVVVVLLIVLLSLMGCSSADVASRNISTAADNFEIQRRVVFYNGITGEYMLSIEGRCSLGNQDKNGEISVTCKTAPNEFKKHYLGLSDNVTYFAEQLDAATVDEWHYRVIFKPAAIVPDAEISVP